MNNISFVDRVKMHFDYLVSEYGFKMVREDNSATRPQTDGVVEYVSDRIGIVIDSETGYVGVRLYRIKDSKKYYLTPIDIYEYLNTSVEEKQLLLSTDPADNSAASTLSNKKLLLNQPNWKGSRGNVNDLDNELRNFSIWIKEHADLCLTEDLSWWIRFYEYKINKARANHLRRGESEIKYKQIKDIDGKWKLTKSSIFQDELEQLEKLRQEFSHK